MSKLTRAANTQKCIRAGGKHNDLEDVGKDVYHHTFFEMLGNWSFGDYFKREAITWAWALLTKVYKLPEERLYITYFEGNDQVPCDTEALEIWKEFVPEARILPFDAKDNFWEMGEVGPCGPCSEIHFDRIGGRDASALVNMDDPDVLEIWNLVFMQFNRKPDGSLEKLPAQSVDTGMGFERLTSVLQDKRSNYDTDIFAPIFREIEKHAGVRGYEGRVGEEDKDQIDMAYRVLSDHIRTLTFAIADGAVPSNDGRGYVLRRILRRAVRYAQDVLKMPKRSFSKLAHVVVAHMHSTFPEIKKKEKYIVEILQDEEATFERTLKRGLDHFSKSSDKLLSEGKKIVPGELVFRLYESMGFPVDLTELMAEEKGMSVDLDGYEKCMQEHVEISKKKKTKNEFVFPSFESKETAALEGKNIIPTEHHVYTESDVDATVMAIFDAETKTFVDTSSATKIYGIVLDKTSMYYESGGQIADEGSLKLVGTENEFQVQDVQSAKGYIVHIGSSPTASIAVGSKVTVSVDYNRREKIARNHTSTHIINWALRKVLGTDVDQAGSIVTEDYFRFDFTSKKGLNDAQIGEVETLVQHKIEAGEAVDTQIVPLEETKKIKALRAVFGETYPDPVRVVAVGCKISDVLKSPEEPKWFDYSIELCGGTHVKNSSIIRKMVVLSEEAKGKGIRRLVALTDEKAMAAYAEGEKYFKLLEESNDVNKLNEMIKVAEIPATQKKALLDKLNKRKSDLVELEKKQLKECTESCIAACGEKDIQVITIKDKNLNASKLVKGITKKIKNKSFMLLVKTDKDVSIAVSVCKSHLEKVDAKKWFDVVAAPVEARGGGKGGNIAGKGTNVSGFSEAEAQANAFLEAVS
eukprot:CAMPEP_0184015286 /NCGR_PEP_ID=MMETSP0954-20121128/6206_1 /TAXON_ID=627963 /ORGANISM="Aplanochytrium sp, Strain PBS07" /LENGTH=863 /DNA_ID=CAMNT_0026296013 /DNA_START=425 /DNA_END=3013 /DNA_ORIENTATION=+